MTQHGYAALSPAHRRIIDAVADGKPLPVAGNHDCAEEVFGSLDWDTVISGLEAIQAITRSKDIKRLAEEIQSVFKAAGIEAGE